MFSLFSDLVLFTKSEIAMERPLIVDLRAKDVFKNSEVNI